MGKSFIKSVMLVLACFSLAGCEGKETNSNAAAASSSPDETAYAQDEAPMDYGYEENYKEIELEGPDNVFNGCCGFPRRYWLHNVSSGPLTLKWVVVNKRSECLLAPSRSGMLNITDEPEVDYWDTATINIGQRITLDVPSRCGRIVYLRLGDVDREFEVKF